MNRLLCLVREHLAALGDETDRRLLDGFLAERDEGSFAELVRRYGPLVWGVCRRRLNCLQDAEDAFQATFLVLVRRATAIAPETPIGPWLHRVAVLTARNVRRQNRRRAAISGPMAHDVAACAGDPSAALDLDAALLSLPARDREPVVLCHLQGLSRREAARRLACPEGTLSARLHRALTRLKARLGDRATRALGIAAAAAVPASLQAAAVRSAVIFSTSTTAGVSPAVAGLTDGVLRMLWMKKLLAGLAAAILVAGGLLAGFATRADGVARAEEPLAAEPQSRPDDPESVAKRIEKQIEEVRKQKERLAAMEKELFAEKEKLEEARKAKAVAAAAAELGRDIAVSVGDGNPSGYNFTVREVVNGKVAEIHTSDIDILRTYLTRAFDDPRGPKQLRISAFKDHPADKLREVFAACAAAGFEKASFSLTERVRYRNYSAVQFVPVETVFRDYTILRNAESAPKPGVIDLTKYVPQKR
jgi:RNA polymerase sigma factor (sigma-70 family)